MSDDLPSYIPADLRASVVQILETNPATMETAATAHVRAGEHRGRGEMVEAAVWFGAACVLCERLLGERHPDALTSRDNLAVALQAAGRTEDAIAILRLVVDGRRRILGEDDPETLSSLCDLDECLIRADRVADAIDARRLLADHNARARGEEHPATVRWRCLLALSLLKAGRPSDAIAILEPLLAKLGPTLAADEAFTLFARDILATSLVQEGRIVDAVTILKPLVADYARVLSEDDSRSLRVRNELAVCFLKLGRSDLAIAGLRALVEHHGRLKGVDPRSALSARSNLAAALRDSGRLIQAIEMQAQIVCECTERLGGDDVLTLTCRSLLVESRQLLWDPADATQILEALAADCDRVLGKEHEVSLTVHSHLAESLRAQGRIAEAVDRNLEVYELRRNRFGESDPRTLTSASNLAISLVDAGMTEEAVVALEQCWDALPVTGDWLSREYMVVANNLAMCHLLTRRVGDAIGRLVWLCAVFVDSCGAEHPQTLCARLNLAVSLLHSGNFEGSEKELVAVLGGAARLRETVDDVHGRAMLCQVVSLHTAALALAAVRVARRHDAAMILDALEAGTARSVLDLLHMRGLDRRAAAQALVDRGAWSDGRRDEYGADLDRLVDLEAQDDLARRRGLHADDPRRAGVLREAEAVRTRLAEAERAMLPAARPRSMAEIRGSLRAGEALFLYGWSGLGLTLVVIPAKETGEPKAFRLDRIAPVEGELPQDAVRRGQALIGSMEAVATLLSIGLSSELGRSEDARRALGTIAADEAVVSLLGQTVLADCDRRVAALERADRWYRERKERLAVPSLPAATLDALSRAFMDFVLPEDARASLAGVSRLFVAPSGPLHELPFDALLRMASVDGLAEMPVTVVPSGSILAMLRERDARSEFDGPTIVGDPDFGGAADEGAERDASSWLLASLPRDASTTLQRLPFAKVEAEVVADYHNRCLPPNAEPVRPLVESEATPAAVRDRSRGRRELVIAAHAVLGRLRDPFSSAVVLATERRPDGSARPGLLSLDRLITHWGGHLEGCELVVLSCCSTGRGVRLGDSLMGLPIGFFHAGVRCVVASLWAVDDVATCLLMLRFHQNRLGLHCDLDGHAETGGREAWGRRYGAGERMPVGAALVEAKRWLRKARTRELRGFLGRHEPAAAPPTDPEELPPPTRAQMLEARERETGLPPFAHAEHWSAFVLIGDA